MSAETIGGSSRPIIQRLVAEGSPLYGIMALDLNQMTWDPELQQAVLPWIPTMRHQAREGLVHGGVSSLFLDTAAGFAANMLVNKAGNTAVTVEMRLAYKAPVPVGEPLLVIATVTGRDGKAIFLGGEIVPEGDLQNPMVTADVKMLEVSWQDITR